GTSTCCAVTVATNAGEIVEMKNFPSITEERACDKQCALKWQAVIHHFAQNWRRTLLALNPHHRQWKTQPQLLLQINLDVVQTELLKLDATKIVHVGGVAFHFLELEFNFRLGEHILLVYADNARSLPEFADAATPARPDAQPQIINRQRRRGNDVEHADQRVRAVKLATNVLAEHAALQVGEDRIRRFHRR